MRERRELKENWKIRKADGEKTVCGEAGRECDDGWYEAVNFPAQVQDILYEHGVLSEEFRVGWCREALFIGESDWIYRCEFSGDPARRSRLIFEGVDTVADFYLNGVLLGHHTDFYLPAEFDTTEFLQKENRLEVFFRSPLKYLETLDWDPKWSPAVLRCKAMRKPIHDFRPEGELKGSNYQGAVPYFTPVGLYAPVYLEYYETEEITECHFDAEVLEAGDGKIRVSLKGTGRPDWIVISVLPEDETVLCTRNTCLEANARSSADQTGQSGIGDVCSGIDPVEDSQCAVKEAYLEIRPIVDGDGWHAAEELTVEQPPLWNPRGFGAQPLFRASAVIWKASVQQDCRTALLGFRRVESPAPLAFIINGKKVRLFGGSLDPMQGYTHCYQDERAGRLFDMVENARMNTLRIWGEGIPLPDRFYEECDRRGILVWQEFFLGHGAYPDSPAYRDACVAEAEVLIKRLRSHPCLLLWCGGNETIMGAQFQGYPVYGSEIALEALQEVVAALDPGRYYHVNSPYGGDWADDPRQGDFHTYDCVWEYPYRDYPNFISEHIRTSPPVLHSLERMVHGSVWERDGQGQILGIGPAEHAAAPLMPENWLERTHPGAFPQRKTAAFWEFYDASEPDDFIYRFGAAYGKEIKRYAEQVRIGSREPAEFTGRSKGYFACKLVDTWPKIYCAPIDFFQEAYIPYYALKRAFAPVCLCFQKEESIRLWCVNDSAQAVEREIEFGLLDLRSERIIRQERRTVWVAQGDAVMVFDLAAFQFFHKDTVLFARALGETAGDTEVCIDYVDLERHLDFPDPQLQIRAEGEYLIIKARHFARSVEILGEQDGDKFGWLFEDNYFDLLPGQEKRVRILGDKAYGTLTVKPRYGTAQKISIVRDAAAVQCAAGHRMNRNDFQEEVTG